MAGVLLIGSNASATPTANAWTVVPMSNEVYNDVSGASTDTSAETVTLPVGTYRISVGVYMWKAGKTAIRLYDVTNGAVIGSEYGWHDAGGAGNAFATKNITLRRKLTVSGGAVTIRAEYFTTSTSGNLGNGTFGTPAADSWIMVEPATEAGALVVTGVTNGSAATVGSWAKRNIGATLRNTVSGATVDTGANTISLPSGVYSGAMIQTLWDTQGTQTRFYNNSDSAVIQYSGGAYCEFLSNGAGMTIVQPIMFTIAATKTVQPEYRVTKSSALLGLSSTPAGRSGVTGQDLYLRLIKH